MISNHFNPRTGTFYMLADKLTWEEKMDAFINPAVFTIHDLIAYYDTIHWRIWVPASSTCQALTMAMEETKTARKHAKWRGTARPLGDRSTFPGALHKPMDHYPDGNHPEDLLISPEAYYLFEHLCTWPVADACKFASFHPYTIVPQGFVDPNKWVSFINNENTVLRYVIEHLLPVDAADTTLYPRIDAPTFDEMLCYDLNYHYLDNLPTMICFMPCGRLESIRQKDENRWQTASLYNNMIESTDLNQKSEMQQRQAYSDNFLDHAPEGAVYGTSPPPRTVQMSRKTYVNGY